MVRDRAMTADTRPFAAVPREIRVAFIALGGLAVVCLAYGSNREIAQLVDVQVANAESEFCTKLGIPAGAQHDDCIHAASRLVQREQEIRSAEF